MQVSSNEFDEAMRKPFRNRGYIRISIGVVNSDAQNHAELKNTKLTYFANSKKPFDGYEVGKVYAMPEQDFTTIDGKMYFLPDEMTGYEYYNNGIVTDNLLGSVRLEFGHFVGLDIKGLTIDFGDCFPTKFTIESDSGTRTYTNDKRLFVTEDSFDGTSYIVINPIEMVNGQGRLRIYQMVCGIANVFSNEKVISCDTKEYVSSISDTIPSMDTTLVIDNHDLYYSADNPESAIAYMEVGQEVKVTFGYDVTGKGDIEWLNETTTYLNSWKANDEKAEFTSTDRFYQLSDNYYRGKVRTQGISLYDLAVDVLQDAGIEDERQFSIDSYLEKIIVYNPMPVVTHAEALQIIANAGRCVLYEDKKNKIHLKSSFVPDMNVTANDKTDYSNLDFLLEDTEKYAYAVASDNFTTVDGSMFFIPDNQDDYFYNTGYVSNSVSDSNGDFSTDPKLTITLESGFVAYGIKMVFRSVAPKQFKIITYRENAVVAEIIVDNPELMYANEERFEEFDKMEIVFTKAEPNSRIFVDNILIGDVTNYTIKRMDLKNTPTGSRQQKVKNIVITKTNYRKSSEEIKEILSEDIDVSELTGNNEYTIYLVNPSYGYSLSVEDNSKVKATVLETSDYYVRVRFTGITTEDSISVSVKGYEYIYDETYYRKQHNVNGQEIEWSNPLISTTNQAKDLEEWLASYYLGDVDYDISWRGDPRTEANDLFYLELKDREPTLIRSYENEISFNGSWSGSMKARKVATSWQKNRQVELQLM